MVGSVKVVVEEEQAQQGGVLDHGHTMGRRGLCPMLGERAQKGQGEAWVDESEGVERQWEMAADVQPDQHRRQGQQVD